MSGDVPDEPDGAGGHPVWHDLRWLPGGWQGLLPGTVGSAVCAAVCTFTNTYLYRWEKAITSIESNLDCYFSASIHCLWNPPYTHTHTPEWVCVCVCVVFPGWFRRASCLPNGKWDLGAGWGREFWTGLCSPKPARCVHQTDQLLKLHQRHDTRDQAVWASWSELVWEGCCVGQLFVHSADAASEINHFENWVSGR